MVLASTSNGILNSLNLLCRDRMSEKQENSVHKFPIAVTNAVLLHGLLSWESEHNFLCHVAVLFQTRVCASTSHVSVVLCFMKLQIQFVQRGR